MVAVLAALGGLFFWLNNRKLDKEEDLLNNLPNSKFQTRQKVSDAEAVPRPVETVQPVFEDVNL